MQQRYYAQVLGGTGACVVRGVKEMIQSKHHHDVSIVNNNKTPYVFLGDSWFGSARAANNPQLARHHVYW